MVLDLTTARTLADYKKLLKEKNQRLKEEIMEIENEVIFFIELCEKYEKEVMFYIELCEKYEKELLKYEKKERGKVNERRK